jgi:hypothetical protein
MSGRAHVDGRGGDAQMGWGNPKRTEGVWGQGEGGVGGGGAGRWTHSACIRCRTEVCFLFLST